MSNVEIGVSIKADTAAATKSIADLNNEIKASRQQLNNAKIGSDEYKQASLNLKSAQEQLTTSTKEKGSTFGALKDQLKSTVPALDGAANGVIGLGKQFLALLANPIVLLIAAIVVGLKLLYEAFTATDEGGQKVQAIFDGIGAVVRELMQRLSSLAGAIIKVMSGDFKGAMEDGKKAVTGMGDAMVDAFNRGKEASNLLDEIEDSMRVLNIQYAAMTDKLNKAKEIASDENATFAQRRKANKESAEELDKYYKTKSELDDKEINAIGKKYNIEKQIAEARKKGWGESAKDLDDFLQTLAIGKSGIEEVEKSITKSIQSQAEYSAKSRQQNKLDKQLDKQEEAKEKEEEAKFKAKKKEEEEKERSFNAQQRKLENEIQLAQLKDARQKELTQSEQKYKDEQIALNNSLKDKKITQSQYDILAKDQLKAHELEVQNIKDKFDADELKKRQEHNKIKFERESKFWEDLAKEVKDKKTKERNDTIKLNDSELSLAKAKHKATYAMELDAYLKKRELERQNLVDAGASKNELQAFDNETAANTIQREEEKTAARLKGLETLGSALGNVGKLVGEQTVAGKGIAVAQATIDTYAGATKAFAQGGIFGYIGAAGIIASGLANVSKILSTEIPGTSGGSGGGSTQSISVRPPVQPQSTATTLDANSIQSMGNAAIRSFVLESDVSSNQERITRLNRQARLG